MSLVTTVPYNRSHTATLYPFLYLGFMTGVLLLQTADLAVTVAEDMDWKQQVVFMFLWAGAVTLLAYLVMMCVQRIAAVEAENVDTFQVVFFVGVFSALVSTILSRQILLGNQRMLCSLLFLLDKLLVLVVTCVPVSRNAQDRDEQSVAISTEPLMIV